MSNLSLLSYTQSLRDRAGKEQPRSNAQARALMPRHIRNRVSGIRRSYFLRLLAIILTLVALLAPCQPAIASSETTPHYTIRDKTPSLIALINATVVTAPGKSLEDAVVLINDGIIKSVGANVKIPDGATVIDLTGKTIYPGFIDPYTEYGLTKDKKSGSGRRFGGGPKPTIERIGGNAWNGAFHAEKNWVEGFKPSASDAKSLIEKGFTVVQSAKRDGIFRGQSFITTLGKGAPNDLILDAHFAQMLSFDKGSSKQDYPTSLMGSIALIRQAVMDVTWYRSAQEAYHLNHAQEKPEFNATLAALQQIKSQPIFFETNDEQSLLRADRIAREFSLKFTHIGSGEEYMRLGEIKATRTNLILPVVLPKKPNVKTLENELDVTLATLRHWDMAPSNAAMLAEKDVTFSFTTLGLKKKSSFWKNVRKMVKRGLSESTALAALTTVPAKLLNQERALGTIERGKMANFVVTDGNIFAKDTKLLSVWIQGKVTEIESAPPTDMRGTYALSVNSQDFELRVAGKSDKPSGKMLFKGQEDDTAKKLRPFTASDNKLEFSLKLDTLGFDGSLRFTARLENDTLFGACALPDGQFVTWIGPKTAAFDPDAARKEDSASADSTAGDTTTTGADSESKSDSSKSKEKDEEDDTVIAKLTYPNLAFGFTEKPKSQSIMFQHATVWTSDEKGILEDADVLVRGGKFIAVGKNLEIPSGVLVFDATGKHITPGIIDEHSHIAISRGVNECSEAITAEVRIGDVVNPDDLTIYRQLAGGVTASQLLHGSCNPIGGQAQVIKLRWGSSAEEMKFAEAPLSVKFALGENVKHSNFGDKYTVRYPQSRMGVETIMRDGFQAALEFKKTRQAYNQLSNTEKGKTVPPRENIETKALLQILNSEMFVHCHSYVQSEILMLMRLAESFDFRIQTFTHILEGYKVADEMAKHGATASTFSDWWAYKFEVYDAIPYNAALMTEKQVISSVNSDNGEMGRRLNQEAAKSVLYGGMSQEEALKLVTINPAIQLKVDKYVGSVRVGKQADFVVWNGNPLSVMSSVEQTWIDGRQYFGLEKDAEMRRANQVEKSALIQRALKSKDASAKPGGSKGKGAPGYEWTCEDDIDVWRIGK
jgi:imidazolonepropionase-like amidohydrolase